MAIEREQDQDAAELRYWGYVEAGLGTQEAFQEVRAELER